MTTATRSNALPDVPAVAEFLPGYEGVGWYGVCVPHGVAADIIGKLALAIVASAGDATFKSRLAALGVEPRPMNTAEFTKFVTDEIAKWAKVIQFAGIKAQ